MYMPEFPEFKPIELSDREAIYKALIEYRPDTSEMTFTNLFIWRACYDTVWTRYRDWLLFKHEKEGYGLPPIGPGPRLEPVRVLLHHLSEKGSGEVKIERADERMIQELAGAEDLIIAPARDHFDYIYRTEDLIKLPGRKYDAKRNHLNYFRKNNQFTYHEMTREDLVGCIEMTNRWCQVRRCEDDLSLHDEYLAVISALNYFRELNLEGGLIKINDRIEAFALGEPLNEETVVVHVEKADAEIRGLYAAINQQFAEHSWSAYKFINREQDLGEPTLRKAKESYNPDHMAKKYRITFKQ